MEKNKQEESNHVCLLAREQEVDDMNSELLLSSLDTSVVTAESSERDPELRGGEEHLKISQTEFMGCRFYSFRLHMKDNFIECITISIFC